METTRRWWTVLAGVYCGLFLASEAHRLTGLSGIWLLLLTLVCASVGAAVGLATAHELRPMDSRDRRDALIGWGIVGALLAALPLGALIGFWDW
ncbi:MAG: hypothetical protein QOJ29_3637 [Thermoleophilaceae bacterium]|jgi:predicted MFS family arabinose efflux permease|nr:hypothetical protein [Thermoleophilaceae bacterium]